VTGFFRDADAFRVLHRKVFPKTLVDITALKTSVEEVTAARDSAEAIVDTVREPLPALDGALRVKSASRSFYETFRVAPEVTVNQFVYDLGNRQWNIPALRVVLRDVVEKNARVEDFEVKHAFEGIGRRIMLLNARQSIGRPGPRRRSSSSSPRARGPSGSSTRPGAKRRPRPGRVHFAMLGRELGTPLNAILGGARDGRDRPSGARTCSPAFSSPRCDPLTPRGGLTALR